MVYWFHFHVADETLRRLRLKLCHHCYDMFQIATTFESVVAPSISVYFVSCVYGASEQAIRHPFHVAVVSESETTATEILE